MQCAHCGHPNRLGARFCARCGQPLTRPAAPVSQAQAPANPRPRGRRTHRRLGFSLRTWAVAGLILIVATLGVRLLFRGGASSTATPPRTLSGRDDALQTALAGAVQIVVPDDSRAGSSSTGSGTVLSEEGYILTNFHVLGDVAGRRLYNREGNIFVGVSPAGVVQAPELLYRAQVVDADYDLDLALLRIVATIDGGRLPPDLGLTAVPVGDSDSVQIGDELTIIGFPGLGGSTVTLTRGSVAGFITEDGWIKTDAEINPGNSGGAAIDEAGELVGVPTAGAVAQAFPGKLGLVRPINLAAHLIAQVE